ncbi:MAG: SMC-Scp complex subunit ScpB, partial [Alcanivoracaceae bacterium]|nr:SMC-Scp complex subunit ScpB [Alcanivoracaceae bacterium]
DESTLMSLDQVDAVLAGFEAEFRKKPSAQQEEQADADNTTPDMLEEDISGEDDNEPTHE